MCKCEENAKIGMKVREELCPWYFWCQSKKELLKKLPKEDKPMVNADGQANIRFRRLK